MRILMNRSWKGQIRELENVIERAMIFTESDYIDIVDLPSKLAPNQGQVIEKYEEFPLDLKAATKIFEHNHILKVLEQFNNHREKTAQALGINVSSLYRKLSEQ